VNHFHSPVTNFGDHGQSGGNRNEYRDKVDYSKNKKELNYDYSNKSEYLRKNATSRLVIQ